MSNCAVDETRGRYSVGCGIGGVELKILKSFPDERGYFREVLRCTDSIFTSGQFAQWSHSHMHRDVVKAWHYHHVQTDWWYVPIGQVLTVLFDNRSESPTYRAKFELKMGESTYGSDTVEACLKIPPGVLHGCRVLSEAAHLFYVTSETYNPKDEGRIPFNDSLVPHDWGGNAITSEKDRRIYVPELERKRL